MASKKTSTLLVWALVLGLCLGEDCDRRDFGADSFVCVCNGQTCNLPGTILPPTDANTFKTVTSSRDGLRFDVQGGNYEDSATDGASVIHVNRDYEYQEIFGFGGAFTDSTGLNIATLSSEAQDNVIKSYFAPEGNQYAVCRIPIAGSDFSTRPYSYDDVWNDVSLENFALADEDHNYKLPYIKQAIEISDRDIKLFGSPWAPPAWMKENGMHNGTGGLLKDMWQPYAEYFVKFIQSYEAEGIPIWGITTQNEPMTGFEDWPWNTCAWTAEDTRDWVANNLGPTLESHDLRRVKVMIVDHNRDLLPWYPATCLEDPDANKYIDGIAVHWYADGWVGPGVLSETASMFPDKFMLYTEACAGWAADAGSRVVLGDWSRGEEYANNIIDDLINQQAGWVDWNMALDMQGGPNWANNFVDSPIIINKDADEFYKQPTFYVLGHFSKFMIPGGKAVYSGVSGNYENIRSSIAHNPDGSYTSVLLNKDSSNQKVSLQTGTGKYINIEIPAKSITTLMFS